MRRARLPARACQDLGHLRKCVDERPSEARPGSFGGTRRSGLAKTHIRGLDYPIVGGDLGSSVGSTVTQRISACFHCRVRLYGLRMFRADAPVGRDTLG